MRRWRPPNRLLMQLEKRSPMLINDAHSFITDIMDSTHIYSSLVCPRNALVIINRPIMKRHVRLVVLEGRV